MKSNINARTGGMEKMTTDLWYDLLLCQVSNDEASYILAASPLEGSVNAEVFQYRTEIQEAPEQISQ